MQLQLIRKSSSHCEHFCTVNKVRLGVLEASASFYHGCFLTSRQASSFFNGLRNSCGTQKVAGDGARGHVTSSQYFLTIALVLLLLHLPHSHPPRARVDVLRWARCAPAFGWHIWRSRQSTNYIVLDTTIIHNCVIGVKVTTCCWPRLTGNMVTGSWTRVGRPVLHFKQQNTFPIGFFAWCNGTSRRRKKKWCDANLLVCYENENVEDQWARRSLGAGVGGGGREKVESELKVELNVRSSGVQQSWYFFFHFGTGFYCLLLFCVWVFFIMMVGRRKSEIRETLLP